MKYIVKQPEPQWFIDWKAAHPGATYDNFKHKARKLREALVTEQHHLCCYCECLVEPDTSHNEHFKPKGNAAYSHLQLSYGNIFASCLREPNGDPETHCGHKKGNDYDVRLVSPLEADCATHFKYTLEGKISSDDERGRYTIGLLKLDSALLDAMRKQLIDDFNDLDEDVYEDEMKKHLDSDASYYGEFYTMVEYLRQTKQL